MSLRSVGFLVVGLLLIPLLSPQSGLFQSALAQGKSTPREDPPASKIGTEYTSQCWRSGLRCTLVYGEKASNSSSRSSSGMNIPNRQTPLVTGPLAIIVVLALLVVLLGLWMRFGNGGVLLSSAPREMKQRNGEAPESWRNVATDAEERPDAFLQRIAAMEDRKQALVELLRYCLLHAADTTGTRLVRSDTERVVLERLPHNMPGRDLLGNLLQETELVHYGGRMLPESQFTTLLASARSLLSQGPMLGSPAHA